MKWANFSNTTIFKIRRGTMQDENSRTQGVKGPEAYTEREDTKKKISTKDTYILYEFECMCVYEYVFNLCSAYV